MGASFADIRTSRVVGNSGQLNPEMTLRLYTSGHLVLLQVLETGRVHLFLIAVALITLIQLWPRNERRCCSSAAMASILAW